ncbi:hypothetical protein LguiA_010361 [Lonicera macranthoides]
MVKQPQLLTLAPIFNGHYLFSAVIVKSLKKKEERHVRLSASISVIKINQASWPSVSLDNNTCCIWVMKEYGVSESWTKQFTVDMQNGTPFGESGVWLDAGAYGFRDDSEILSSTTIGNLVSFDPESK